MRDYNFMWVFEGDIQILVPRNASFAEIERRIRKEKERLAEREDHRYYMRRHIINLMNNTCAKCDKTLVEIHANKLVCNS